MTPREVIDLLLDGKSLPLEPFIEQGRFVNVRHPLYIGMCSEVAGQDVAALDAMIEGQWPTARRAIAVRQQAVRKALVKGSPSALWLFERPFRPYALLALLDRPEVVTPSRDEARELVEEVWIDVEFPSQSAQVWEQVWERLLPLAEAPWGVEDLPEVVTVHRGVVLADPDEVVADGWSWTTDEDHAVWFAQRFASIWEGEAVVLHGQVDRAEVLFATNARGEAEVVVDSNHVRLTGITEVGP